MKWLFKNIKIIILFLIKFIEKIEYKNIDLSDKIIESHDLTDLEIKTDKGFKPISSIHKTKPFYIWKIKLENGYYLDAADKHIVFDSEYNHIFIKDLKINDYIQTDNGLQKIIAIEKNRIPVSMYDVTVDSEDHRFYSNGILSHNTTTIAAFFAWYLCFHTDRNLAILANKQATTTEIVSKVVQVFKGLPFYLKPGILNVGALGMRLDNGCMLTSQATTATAQIGFTIHVLYIDEFAHIKPRITNEFWRSVYPTLASSDISQCIISSTPDGKENLFYKIWDKSVKGKNDFINKRIDFWEVPGHDDQWAEKIKANFGDEYFAQEFELKFDIQQNTLLEASQLSWINRLSQYNKYEYKELEKTDLDSELYENLEWRKDFDPNLDFKENEHRFVFSIDIAEGKDENEDKDSDYNISSIHQVKLKSPSKLKKLRKDEHRIENLFRLEQVGVYRDNVKDESILAKVNKALTFDQFGDEIVKTVVEMNFNGKSYLKEFQDHDNYYEGLVMRSYHTSPVPGEKPPKKKAGFKVRSDKSYFCKLGKKLIKKKTIVPTHKETYSEFGSFGKVKNSYKGIAKHDDLAMAELNLSRLYSEPEYGDWLYDFLDAMEESESKKIAMEILKEPYEDSNIDDGMWDALYGQEKVPNREIEKSIQENIGTNATYRPGTTFDYRK